MKTTAEILERVLGALPYPGQIHNLDLSQDTELRFTWRGTRWRVSGSFFVEEVDGALLKGSNATLLMEALLGRSR